MVKPSGIDDSDYSDKSCVVKPPSTRNISILKSEERP